MSSLFQHETLVVAKDYMDFCMGGQQSPPSESARAMRKLAKQIEKEQQSTFLLLAHKFLLKCGQDPWTGLKMVMANIVGDGRFNWGRVVALFAFAGVLASELQSRENGDVCCSRLAEMIADFLSGEKQEWLIQNGGWGGFASFFHTAKQANPESSMRTALYAAAGVGLAGITFLLVR